MKINTGSINSGDNLKKAYDEAKDVKMKIFIRGSITAFPTPIKWTTHSAVWKWKFEGSPNRLPNRIIQYRGWKKRIWYFKGSTVVINKNIMEIWIKTRVYKNPIRMIYNAWSRADMKARDFSKWQQIAIEPIPTEHPSDAHKAHLVLQTKQLNKYLKPQADKPESAKVGLHYDESHPDLPEFIGQESIEGVFGADWTFLTLPKEWQELKHAIAITQAKHDLTAQALNKIMEILNKGGK